MVHHTNGDGYGTNGGQKIEGQEPLSQITERPGGSYCRDDTSHNALAKNVIHAVDLLLAVSGEEVVGGSKGSWRRTINISPIKISIWKMTLRVISTGV